MLFAHDLIKCMVTHNCTMQVPLRHRLCFTSSSFSSTKKTILAHFHASICLWVPIDLFTLYYSIIAAHLLSVFSWLLLIKTPEWCVLCAEVNFYLLFIKSFMYSNSLVFVLNDPCQYRTNPPRSLPYLMFIFILCLNVTSLLTFSNAEAEMR